MMVILDVKHGEVGGSDDLGCEPGCKPEKGIHVLRSDLRTTITATGVQKWEHPTLDVQNHQGDD